MKILWDFDRIQFLDPVSHKWNPGGNATAQLQYTSTK
jgi:hypothetical protein